jgi:hypothetical protein
MKYVPLRDLSRAWCFLESRAEQSNMKHTTHNNIPVSPFSATPARASMQLGCAYESTGTEG